MAKKMQKFVRRGKATKKSSANTPAEKIKRLLQLLEKNRVDSHAIIQFIDANLSLDLTQSINRRGEHGFTVLHALYNASITDEVQRQILLEKFLARGANPFKSIESGTQKGFTPIKKALNQSLIEDVLSMLQDGQYKLEELSAIYHTPKSVGTTILHALCLSYQEEKSALYLQAIEVILAKDILIDTPNERDENCLCDAATNGNLALVNFLIAKGANVNQNKNSISRSPFAIACRSKNLNALSALLNARAELPKLKDGQLFPLDCFIDLSQKEMLEILKEHHPGKVEQALLSAACADGNIEKLKAIKDKIDINAQVNSVAVDFTKNKEKKRSLGLNEESSLIFDEDCDFELIQSRPIEIVIANGHPPAAKMLLEKFSVDVNFKLTDGTPFFFNLLLNVNKNLWAIKLLIEHSNVNLTFGLSSATAVSMLVKMALLPELKCCAVRFNNMLNQLTDNQFSFVAKELNQIAKKRVDLSIKIIQSLSCSIKKLSDPRKSMLIFSIPAIYLQALKAFNNAEIRLNHFFVNIAHPGGAPLLLANHIIKEDFNLLMKFYHPNEENVSRLINICNELLPLSSNITTWLTEHQITLQQQQQQQQQQEPREIINYPPATEEKASSSTSYLLEQGYSIEEIRAMRTAQQAPSPAVTMMFATEEESIALWFDSQISAEHENIKPIENSANNDYFCFVKELFSADEITAFENTRPKFVRSDKGDEGIKPIESNWTVNLKLAKDTTSHSAKIKYELKKKGTDDRLLIAEITGTDGRSRLLLPVYHLKGGAHNTQSKTSLAENRILEITLPWQPLNGIDEPQEKLSTASDCQRRSV